MKPSRVGVAVVTYNGLMYLPRQLESILAQTRRVDHIVVSDDCSSDGTWDYLETWARACPVEVTLIRNERQLGLVGNVEQAVSAVKADIVFTSDQDDVWFADKVHVLAGALEAQPAVLLVHTDADLVDAEGRELKRTLFCELGVSARERCAIQAGKAFDVYSRRNIVTGATMAFRKSLLELAQPLPRSWYHDAWLAWMAAATGRVLLIDRPTIQYRQHGANLVGVKRLGSVTKLRRLWWKIAGPSPLSTTLAGIESARSALHARLSGHPAVAPACLAVATESLEFVRRRKAWPRNHVARTAVVLKHAFSGRYERFSTAPWSDALRDVLNR